MGYHAGSDVHEALARAFRSNESELASIYEISKLLASPDPIEKTLSSVLTLLSSFLGMRHGLVALLDEQGHPRGVIGSGWNEASSAKFFDHLPQPAVRQIFLTKMPLVVEKVADSPLFEGSDLSQWGPSDGVPFSLFGVPIKEGDRIVGVLTVDRLFDSQPRAPYDHDIRFLAMVANLIGQTLRLHKLVARDRERLIQENARSETGSLRNRAGSNFVPLPGILGESRALRAVVEKIRIVAKSKSTVLLRGETGTGKEIFATALHNLSPRRNKPFVKLNCAALSESVLESELFGHERGAFTGALNLHKGRFELADGGTLFLDEIGEISPPFQAKLLRVLQEGEFERVGGTRTIKVDVRLICATHRDLEEEVQRGKFRVDLYYRISVVPIRLPPLRERKSDIALLANEFLDRFNKEQGAHLSFSPSAIDFLSELSFPGNIRELENYVLRTATLATQDVIKDKDLSCLNDANLSPIPSNASQARGNNFGRSAPAPVVANSRPSVSSAAKELGAAPEPGALCPGAENCSVAGGDQRSTRERIVSAMEQTGWVKAKAARLLGLTPRQIAYALEKYNVPVKKF